jgi:hypothetical protein
MSNYAKATLIALPRVAMGVLFLAAAIKFYPERNDKWFAGNIDVPAWLFGAGSWSYIIATFMDGFPHFQSKNYTKIAIFFVYLAAGLCVAIGSIWFLQDVQRRHSAPELGQGLYVSAGVIMLAAVHWDILLIMMEGKKISLANSIAVLAIIPGAALFTVATMFSYPRYLVRYQEEWAFVGGFVPEQVAFEFAASLFCAASMFFILHAFAYLFTAKEMLDEAALDVDTKKPASVGSDETKQVGGDGMMMTDQEDAPTVTEKNALASTTAVDLDADNESGIKNEGDDGDTKNVV